MILYYNPAKIFVDDKTDIPGLIEMVCNDHKISVIKQSGNRRIIVEYHQTLKENIYFLRRKYHLYYICSECHTLFDCLELFIRISL